MMELTFFLLQAVKNLICDMKELSKYIPYTPYIQQTTIKSGPRSLPPLQPITEHLFNDQSQICPLPQQNEGTISASEVGSNTDQ